MIKKLSAIIMALALMLVHAPTETRAQVATNEVVVDDTSFQPVEVAIDPGETVTWRVQEDGHTITSENEAFDFKVKSGDVKKHTFSKEGTFRYFCRVHASMRGVIRVGDGCSGRCERTCRDCERDVRTVPSLAFPTIESALDGAPARTLVALLPGRYAVRSTLLLAAPGVGIRGTKPDGSPTAPNDVVLHAEQGARVGIRERPYPRRLHPQP